MTFEYEREKEALSKRERIVLRKLRSIALEKN